MGLDQYAFARKEGEEDLEIMCWRKHANLEGWMANLYRNRGGTKEFNCVELKLREEDLDSLSEEHEDLEVSGGFFWGESCEEDIQDTHAFIELAYQRVRNGYEIIYTSWW
jgi:hypothetical protein